MEIYANIGAIEVDLNVENQLTDDYVPSLLPYTEHLYSSNDLTTLFNSFPMEGNTFTPFPTHVQ